MTDRPDLAERDELIRRVYAEGATLGELARRFSLSRSYLRHILRGRLRPCAYRFPDGRPCRTGPLADEAYCWKHDPDPARRKRSGAARRRRSQEEREQESLPPAARLALAILEAAVAGWKRPSRLAEGDALALGFPDLRSELTMFFQSEWCRELLGWLGCEHLNLLELLREVDGDETG